MADDSDQIAVAARLHAQDAKPALGVMEGDTLDGAGEELSGGGVCLAGHGLNRSWRDAFKPVYLIMHACSEVTARAIFTVLPCNRFAAFIIADGPMLSMAFGIGRALHMHCRAQPAERLSAAHAGRRHRRADRRLRRLLRARPWMRRRLIQRAARERVVPAGSAHFLGARSACIVTLSTLLLYRITIVHRMPWPVRKSPFSKN